MSAWEKFKVTWKQWSQKGMAWPFVNDPVKDKPSVTLLFFYIAFCIVAITIASSSTLLLISGDYMLATSMPMLMWLAGFVFYRLRRLDSIKINLKEQSLELDGGEEEGEAE